MRVDSNPNLTVNPASSNRLTEVAPSPTRTAETSPVADSSFTPTPDLLRLLSAVKDIPDVRDDVVADVTERVSSGELSSPQAATETAQALIDANSLSSN